MALIRNRSVLIIDAIIRDNPELSHLNRSNVWVYRFREEEEGKASALVHGRYGMGAYGRTRVKYNKFDVDVMSKECNKRLPRTAAMSTVGVLATINELFGFALKYDEIVDHRIVNGLVILEPKSSSPLWRGRTEFYFYDPGPALGGIITDREADISAVDKYDVATAFPGSMLSMGHDYTELRSTLSAFIVDAVIDQSTADDLSVKLKGIDGVSWGFLPDTAYSLAGARVVFNGLVSEAPASASDMISSKFDNVLVLELSGNVNLSATPVVFHYNNYTTIWS